MFNTATGLGIWCSESATIAIVLFMMWWHNRQTQAYLVLSIGFMLSALGLGLVAARGAIPNIFSIEIGNTIALAGQTGWIAGMLLLNRKKRNIWMLLPPVIWLCGVFLPWVNDSYPNRVALYNLASAAGAAALAMAAAPVHAKEKINVYLSSIFVLQAGICLTVAIAIAMVEPSDTGAVYYAAIGAGSTAFLLTFAFAITCWLMIERAQRRLKLLVITDPLTGVLNRRGLLDSFDQLKRRLLSDGSKIGILLFDLDHFKRINDRYGHHAGDAVLIAFTRAVRQFLRSGDGFGRMGGEEFAVFLKVSDQFELEATAEAIRHHFDRMPVMVDDNFVYATVSVGAAMASASTVDRDKLISAADRALYAAKAAGRNCTIVFNEDETAAAPATDSDTSGELVPTLDDQIHALRRMRSLAQM